MATSSLARAPQSAAAARRALLPAPRCLLAGLALLASPAPAGEARIVDPAGTVPILHQVDVCIVGGSAGAVAAAVAAAAQGASVFLAAPRTYLGDDICATYRYALAPDETPADPLARAVFWAAAEDLASAGNRVPFTYTASRPAWSGHPDPKGTALADGKWGDSRSQSVQYNGDVTLTLDLQQERPLRQVRAMVYQRPGDFRIDRVQLSSSRDGATWTAHGPTPNPTDAKEAHVDQALALRLPVAAPARYLKLEFSAAPGTDRLLLGEILVESAGPVDPAALARAAANAPLPTPLQVKRALDQALITARVPYLFSSFPLHLLVDAAGQPAGVIIANQSGRQAIVAKVIIDATERATVTRWSTARFTPFPAGPQRFRRVVVGGPARPGANVRLVSTTPPRTYTDNKGQSFPLHEYELTLPLADASPRSLEEAEQAARDLTWSSEAVADAERLHQVPPDAIVGQQSARDSWSGPTGVPLAALQPAGVTRLYVLGGCADVSRDSAARLTRPLHLMALGDRLGRAAAAQAKSAQSPTPVRRAGGPGAASRAGLVRYPGPEGNFRANAGQISLEAGSLPVLGTYDVIVVGGGTGGAPAAIAAGRAGAKTAVLEYLDQLGGVGTTGMISRYYHGNPVGFSQEMDAAVAAMGGSLPVKGTNLEWVPGTKAEWYRQEMRRHQVSIWFSTLSIGAVVDGVTVRGVVVATPHGAGVLLAQSVVDSTGNAAVAAAAGAPCTYTGGGEIAVQGTGLPPLFLAARYTNTDYTFVDETDALDIWRAFVTAREKFRTAFDVGQLIDTRERRRIHGDIELKPTDAVLRRTWPDTVVISRSDFDSHGYTVDPLFLIRQPDRTQHDVPVPYRALLPRGVEGLLVTGLGISVHRDALPLVRMQRDIQNQGYAAGYAAALCAAQGIVPRQLNVPALQQHLVEKRILPPEVIGARDSFPLSPDRVRQAVERVTENYSDIAVILSHVETAKPLLRSALAAATAPAARLTYAHILGLLGERDGAADLRAEVARSAWDTGWNFKGMGQYGASISRLDSLILALGATRDSAAVPVLIAKLRALTPQSEFSHFRALAMALEAIGDPAAARPLADLLAQPGMSGHRRTAIADALPQQSPARTEDTPRTRELTELCLARALYRCGDYEGRGEAILRGYADDLRGHYARHARAVLADRGSR